MVSWCQGSLGAVMLGWLLGTSSTELGQRRCFWSNLGPKTASTLWNRLAKGSRGLVRPGPQGGEGKGTLVSRE